MEWVLTGLLFLLLFGSSIAIAMALGWHGARSAKLVFTVLLLVLVGTGMAGHEVVRTVLVRGPRAG
ncbi:MAG: hypothetical protein ABI873_17705, partial [Marmoricola sp.]